MRNFLMTIVVGILLGIVLSCIIILINPPVLFFPNVSTLTLILFLLCIVLIILGLRELQQEVVKRRQLFFLGEEKNATEEKFREQKNRFESIFHNTNIGIALLDLDG